VIRIEDALRRRVGVSAVPAPLVLPGNNFFEMPQLIRGLPSFAKDFILSPCASQTGIFITAEESGSKQSPGFSVPIQPMLPFYRSSGTIVRAKFCEKA